MTRFAPFNAQELIFLGIGLAYAGRELGEEKDVAPLLGELNAEIAERDPPSIRDQLPRE